MKKKLLCIAVLMLTGVSNSAFIYGQNCSVQSGSILDKLTEKTWFYQDRVARDQGFQMKIAYNCSLETYTSGSQGKDNTSGNKPFYLSDQIETIQFDDSKVGKNQNGKYIISKTGGKAGTLGKGFTVLEIVKLTDTELQLRSLNNNYVSNFTVIAYSMKYIIDKMPTDKLPFDCTKQVKLPSVKPKIAGSQKATSAKHYYNIQLKEVTNPVDGFFRKFPLSNGRYIVVVAFGGDLGDGDNRTDVLCLVDKDGKILSTLEGSIRSKGITMKQFRISDNGNTIYVSQVKPNSSTPVTRFEKITSFTGIVETTTYAIINNKFTGVTGSGSSTKTFTKASLSDQYKNVWQY